MLAGRGEKIEEVARAVVDAAAALSDAVTSTGTRISNLDADLNRIIGLRNGDRVTGPDPAAVAAAVAAAEERYFRMAVDAVRVAGGRVQSDVDAYDALLRNRTARLEGLGYGASPVGGRTGGPTDVAAVVVVPAPPPVGLVATALATFLAWLIAVVSSTEPGGSATEGADATAPGSDDGPHTLDQVLDVADHLRRPGMDHSPANDDMLERINEAVELGLPLSEAQENFMKHELTEKRLMDSGAGYEEAHAEAMKTHPIGKNYDPDIIMRYPEFGPAYRDAWGLPR